MIKRLEIPDPAATASFVTVSYFRIPHFAQSLNHTQAAYLSIALALGPGEELKASLSEDQLPFCFYSQVYLLPCAGKPGASRQQPLWKILLLRLTGHLVFSCTLEQEMLLMDLASQ